MSSIKTEIYSCYTSFVTILQIQNKENKIKILLPLHKCLLFIISQNKIRGVLTCLIDMKIKQTKNTNIRVPILFMN
jgi:hypothetical protein